MTKAQKNYRKQRAYTYTVTSVFSLIWAGLVVAAAIAAPATAAARIGAAVAMGIVAGVPTRIAFKSMFKRLKALKDKLLNKNAQEPSEELKQKIG